jgi:hypothetical protein
MDDSVGVLISVPEAVGGLFSVAVGVVLIIFRAKLADVGLRMNEAFMPWTTKGMKPTQAPVIVIAIALLFFGGAATLYAFLR